jgi:hypothetical protein
LAINSIGVYGIVLAGWASNNKYAMMGGLRSTAQMVSYELSMGLAVVTGLASGETEIGGWQSVLGFGFIALYILAVISLGVGGILLIRDLVKLSTSSSEKPPGRAPFD